MTVISSVTNSFPTKWMIIWLFSVDFGYAIGMQNDVIIVLSYLSEK